MNDVEVTVTATQAGAVVVRRRFGTAMDRIEKGPLDFATDVDIESEREMISVLRAERPADAIIGEETGRSGPTETVRNWLIDPLCGTQNYVANVRMVAVNAALMGNHEALAAAVTDPFTDETFWTDGVNAAVRVSDRDSVLVPDSASGLVDLNFDAPFPNAPTFQTTILVTDTAFVARFRPRVSSTSLALVWVAAGRRAAYVTDCQLEENVHCTAALSICQAAGRTVTDLRGGPWHAGGTGIIAAADAETHTALQEMVLRYLD